MTWYRKTLKTVVVGASLLIGVNVCNAQNPQTTANHTFFHTNYLPLSTHFLEFGKTYTQVWECDDDKVNPFLFASFTGEEIKPEVIRAFLAEALTNDKFIASWEMRDSKYLFKRNKKSPDEIDRERYQSIKDRLGYLQKLMTSKEELKKIRTKDPDIADHLGSRLIANRINLLAGLPDSLIAKAAKQSGDVEIPVSSLTEEQQQLVQTAVGTMSITSTGPDGIEKLAFRGQDVLSKGTLRLLSLPARGKATVPSLHLYIYTDDRDTYTGADVLYFGKSEEYGDIFAEAEKNRQMEQEAELVETSEAKLVTIRKELASEMDKVPLRTYLNSFVKQTNLNLVAYWPEKEALYQRPLSHSLIRKPLTETLDALCRFYKCTWEWKEKGKTILIKPEPPRLYR